MTPLSRRVARMEKANPPVEDLPPDMRTASDKQLEAYLSAAGIDPHDDNALAAAAGLSFRISQ